MSQNRRATWQEKNKYPYGKEKYKKEETMEEKIVWQAFAFVPVIGPLAHAAENFEKNNYIEGSINLLLGGLDIATLGASEIFRAGPAIVNSGKAIYSCINLLNIFGDDKTALQIANKPFNDDLKPCYPLTINEIYGSINIPIYKISHRSLKNSNYLILYDY